jgi:hypothetical protein
MKNFSRVRLRALATCRSLEVCYFKSVYSHPYLLTEKLIREIR